MSLQYADQPHTSASQHRSLMDGAKIQHSLIKQETDKLFKLADFPIEDFNGVGDKGQL